MRLLHNPCKNCEDRHVGCHAECEKYRKAKEETEAARGREKLSREADGYYADYAKETLRRMKNRRR